MSNFVVALTGGICSGKSTVADIFKKLGVCVIDADQLSRELVIPESLYLEKIVGHFGSAILNADKTLNRSLLRKMIFADEKAKMWLEELLHPPIYQLLSVRAREATTPYCLLVIPLLIETLSLAEKTMINRILVVDTDEKNQIDRLIKRESLPILECQSALDAQLNRKERLARANDIIENNASPNDLTKAVTQLHLKYLRLAQVSGFSS